MCVVGCVANGRCALYSSALRCAVARAVARAVQCVAERVAIRPRRKCSGGGRAADIGAKMAAAVRRENGGGGRARKWRRAADTQRITASGVGRFGGWGVANGVGRLLGRRRAGRRGGWRLPRVQAVSERSRGL
jgi:hypothetical protein